MAIVRSLFKSMKNSWSKIFARLREEKGGGKGSLGFGKIIGGGGELSMPLYKGLADINFREKVQWKSLVEISVFFIKKT